MERSRQIINVSIKAIFVNLFLVAAKLVVAFLSSSLAIFLDAINNLSDAFSSIVVIIGTKISKKPREKDHPFGYGRIEYLSSLVLAALILYTGFSALRESVDKILHPTITDYTWATFLVLALAVGVKYFFSRYMQKQGEKLHALSLTAAASDARMDSLISLSTIVSGLVFILFGWNIDGWLGAIIALFIIKAGLDIFKEGTSSLIGNRTDYELSHAIIDRVDQFPEVLGAYDLILHDYGPDMMIGTIHIEVNESMDAREIDHLSRKITNAIYHEFAVLLTVGIYATNCKEDEHFHLEQQIRSIVLADPGIVQMHGFYLDEAEHIITFDAVYSSDLQHPEEFRKNLQKQLDERFKPYEFHIVMDYDYSTSA